MIRSLGLNEVERLVRDSVWSMTAELQDTGVRGADALHPLVESGVLATPLPEELGGMGEGLGAAALVLEPLGQRALVTPFVEALCVPAAIAEACPAFTPLRDALIRSTRAAPGAILAWMEPGRRWSREPQQTKARRDGVGWVLNGNKALVRWGDSAEAFIVSAKVDDETALFWVPTDSPGMNLVTFASADDRTLVDVEMRSVSLSKTCRIEDGDSSATLDYALDAGAALSVAEAVGLMDHALEMTIEYLKTREQFGSPLSRMQALQHRLVEIYASTECAWSLVHNAVCSLTRQIPTLQRQTAVSRAKSYVGRMGRHLGQEALQLHGAIGMTREYPLGHYLMRLTAIDFDYGDSDWHLDRLARILQEDRP